ncbi:hypothetical protein [Novosphingobium sp. CCH12-A3]|uniref:hypothetical protein n=1 Tax=Novosphingobium sp. CCH12-A3 TaxID=1768752 RepID=UPI000B317180|nr:hypothetical protein [Novosphingobium sp. CCH12-A3]
MAHEDIMKAMADMGIVCEEIAARADDKPSMEQNLHMYRSFMEEIKIRMEAIDRFLKRIGDERGGRDTFTDAEAAILQIRYICELIALSTVAAHGLVGVTSRILKSWHAEETFKLLEGVNVNSFPRAVRPSPTVKNNFELQKGEMDLGELKMVYNTCGENLHRGAMKHFFKEARRAYDPEGLVGWVNRIKALLNMHVVMILEQGIVIYVTLSDDNGDVAVAYAQSDGPAVLIES